MLTKTFDMNIKTWQERNNERTQGMSFYMTNDMQAEIDELREKLNLIIKEHYQPDDSNRN